MSATHWMTPEELSIYIGIPVATLYQWRYRGEGPPAAKVGRHLRYQRRDVDDWLTSRYRRGESTMSTLQGQP